MSDNASVTGACLCGSVTLTVAKPEKYYGACHCGMCRKWGGGPLLALDCGAEVAIQGEDSIAVFPSSEWAERGFCKTCGTHLFYRLRQKVQYHIPVGLFGDSVDAELGLQVFIDKKPASYAFANKTKELTEAQIFEMYAPKS